MSDGPLSLLSSTHQGWKWVKGCPALTIKFNDTNIQDQDLLNNVSKKERVEDKIVCMCAYAIKSEGAFMLTAREVNPQLLSGNYCM